MSCPFRKNVSKKKRQEIMLNTNNRHLNNSLQSIPSYPGHPYIPHVLAHSNSPGHSASVISVNSPPGYTNPVPNSITFSIHHISAFEKSSISNAVVISVLIATVKNNEVPGTFEEDLNSLLVANGRPQFKMGNVISPLSFPSTSTDAASLNTHSTSTPSPSLRDKPSTASTDDHSAPPATIYKKKTAEDQQMKIYQSSLLKTSSSSSHH